MAAARKIYLERASTCASARMVSEPHGWCGTLCPRSCFYVVGEVQDVGLDSLWPVGPFYTRYLIKGSCRLASAGRAKSVNPASRAGYADPVWWSSELNDASPDFGSL
jgi:hypothetical protein